MVIASVKKAALCQETSRITQTIQTDHEQDRQNGSDGRSRQDEPVAESRNGKDTGEVALAVTARSGFPTLICHLRFT